MLTSKFTCQLFELPTQCKIRARNLLFHNDIITKINTQASNEQLLLFYTSTLHEVFSKYLFSLSEAIPFLIFDYLTQAKFPHIILIKNNTVDIDIKERSPPC